MEQKTKKNYTVLMFDVTVHVYTYYDIVCTIIVIDFSDKSYKYYVTGFEKRGHFVHAFPEFWF